MEYLKIFVGMGALWIFDIMAALVEAREEYWYVTDVINMLQGVYVFWAQVGVSQYDRLRCMFCRLVKHGFAPEIEIS